MSGKLYTANSIVAGIMIASGLWQPARAADVTEDRRDEARLVLMEEHVEEIASAAKELDRLNTARRGDQAQVVQAEIDKHVAAFGDIVFGYFLARRIKPPASADRQAQEKYLRDVAILHAMNVQANHCREGDAHKACTTLVSLIEKFRASLTDDGKPAVKPADSTPEKRAEPKQAGDEGQSADNAKPDDANQDLGGFQLTEGEKLLFKIVNAYRKKQGLEPMRLDEKLCLAARDHSTDMNKQNFFSHRSPVPGRTRFTDRAKNHDASARAENIARDCKDANMAMKLWVNSQHHRENIIGPYRRMGIGIDEQGYYTQVFGR